MPAGRPSVYDESYCERVIELGKQGMGPAEIASDLGVCRRTLDNWGEAHEEFLAALTRAKTEEQAWFERTGRTEMVGGNLNAPVWKKSMEARFRADYTERKEIDATVTTHEDALKALK